METGDGLAVYLSLLENRMVGIADWKYAVRRTVAG